MEYIDSKQAATMIEAAKTLTFLTGAGVSTASGVPDYRSLAGVYQGVEHPEYLLSHRCMEQAPLKFYNFVKTLYHPEAEPNVIHKKMATLQKKKETWVVSQNIDGLHQKAKTKNLVNFHGNLYDCHCRKCKQSIHWSAYLNSAVHESCGGQIRPNIILYEEELVKSTVNQAIKAVAQAEMIVIVGTNFKVHPFCDLINYAGNRANLLIINQTPIYLNRLAYFFEGNATQIFEKIN